MPFPVKNNGGSYLSSHDLREIWGIGSFSVIDEVNIHRAAPEQASRHTCWQTDFGLMRICRAHDDSAATTCQTQTASQIDRGARALAGVAHQMFGTRAGCALAGRSQDTDNKRSLP